ncbi:response regulator [Chitinophaga tropicalis]|uniref:Response regulator n=1 Tax=Chitinophaga tropicalis TaxID=2683588 RepID=A0A7K1TXB1_9BACT|nr:response regulator transcription factor [Chitinophaga tropicalis]MVT06744.1 response regulator [Chitinophaga tropicalis]
MNNESISLLIVDDHPVVIAGIRSLLQDIENVTIAGSCHNGASAKEFLQQHHADIILLDINLPDISGIDLCLELRKKYPHLRILALSNHSEKSMVARMLENGASGYLLKNASTAELQEAIRDAMNDRLFFSNDVARKMLDTSTNVSLPQLTRREKEILKLIAEGLTSQTIASTLNISQLTVDTHRRNMIQKFNVSSMTAVVKIAMDHSMI